MGSDTRSEQPRISVVMCTYNGELYLKTQLDTIFSQTLPPFEVIAQDDGSTDNTINILKEYEKAHPELKIFINDGEHGVNGNFFNAMQKASGDLIAISDQDDIWMPQKLEVLSRKIGDNLMCVCRSVPLSEDKGTLHYDARHPNTSLIRLLYSSIAGHSMLFKRSIFDYTPPVGGVCTTVQPTM